MTNTPSTRRLEHGLPLFAELDLGVILEAQFRVKKGDFTGLTKLMTVLGQTGKLRTIRKLAAIFQATDLELEQAEVDPTFMAKLEAQAATRPFAETFRDAMDFNSALWACLGVTPSSSAAVEPVKTKGGKRKTIVPGPSGG